MARLFFHSITPLSIGVDIEELDTNYTHNDRTVIWYVSTDGETYVKKNQQTMEGGISSFTGVVTGLTKSTTYYIRAVVVNYAETLSVIDGQGPVTTGSSVTGDKYPIITSAYLVQQQYDYVTANFNFTVDNVCLANYKYYIYINGVQAQSGEFEGINQNFTTRTFSGEANANRYGSCVWEIVFINIVGGKELTDSTSGTVFIDGKGVPDIDEKPNCILERSWTQNYVLNSGNYSPLETLGHSLICRSYPHIAADDWNQFGEDINILRARAGLSDYSFTQVNPNDKMTYTLWNQFVNAIMPLTDVDVSIYMASKYKEMTESFFSDFESLVGYINDTLFAS